MATCFDNVEAWDGFLDLRIYDIVRGVELVLLSIVVLLGEVPAKLVEADLVSCSPVISKLLRPEQRKYKSNQTMSATAQLLALGRP